MSKLDYCNAQYNGLRDYLLNKLQCVQNLAARIVTYTAKYDNITPVLKDLHWLPVCRRIEFKTLLYVYKNLDREAPKYLQDLVSVYKTSHSLRSATSLILFKHIYIRKYAFSYNFFDLMESITFKYQTSTYLY